MFWSWEWYTVKHLVVIIKYYKRFEYQNCIILILFETDYVFFHFSSDNASNIFFNHKENILKVWLKSCFLWEDMVNFLMFSKQVIFLAVRPG
jgi:hypothetical protein